MIIILMCSFGIKAQSIDISFSGIRSIKGQIALSVFKDDKTFQDEKPFKNIKFKKSSSSTTDMLVNINLEPGTYGFALLDDEDNNSEMNYSFIGIPKEGFGFSNYYHSGFKRPKFEQFKFTVTKNQKLKIVMKIRYM